MSDASKLVSRLMRMAGRTYAQQSGIRLKDKPMPLFQLLVLAMLASKPISADVAAAAARELNRAGLRTPRAVLEGDRASAIAAFGRAGYARYDESSATRLVDLATRVRDEFGGDLRRLGERSGHDVSRAAADLQGLTGIGEVGADLFLREVQAVWPWVRPHFDRRARDAARDLGLPTSPDELGDLAAGKPAELAAALVRVSLDDQLRTELTTAPHQES